MERIAPSQRIGEQVTRLVQEGLGGEVERGELRGMLVRLGMQRLVQELLEGEQRAFPQGSSGTSEEVSVRCLYRLSALSARSPQVHPHDEPGRALH